MPPRPARPARLAPPGSAFSRPSARPPGDPGHFL